MWGALGALRRRGGRGDPNGGLLCGRAVWPSPPTTRDFRFQTEEEYDWIGSIDALGLTEELVGAIGGGRCLVLGCGTSAMTARLVAAGVAPGQLVSLDISEVVIEKMRARHGDSCGEWRVGDITRLPSSFPAAAFDVVIDKCTIDALTVDPGDIWGVSSVSVCVCARASVCVDWASSRGEQTPTKRPAER